MIKPPGPWSYFWATATRGMQRKCNRGYVLHNRMIRFFVGTLPGILIRNSKPKRECSQQWKLRLRILRETECWSLTVSETFLQSVLEGSKASSRNKNIQLFTSRWCFETIHKKALGLVRDALNQQLHIRRKCKLGWSFIPRKILPT